MNPRLWLLFIVLLAAVGVSLFLATRDIPAPQHAIQKVISNDRFFN